MPSIYIGIFLIVAFMSLVVIIKPQYDKAVYWISFILMTLFLCIRYGQGTDYTGYFAIYHLAQEAFDPEYGINFYMNNVHSEIGWQLMMIFLQFAKIDFRIFVLVVSGLTMYFTHRFISRFCCQYRSVALMLIYPTVYLTYYFSGMRQGFAMAIFFGVLLEMLLEKKYIAYFGGVLLLCTIHKASFCYLVVPIALMLSKKWYYIGGTASILLSASLFLEPVREMLKGIATSFGVSAGYFKNPSISWLSLAERLLMLSLILLLWYFAAKDEKIKKRVVPLLKIYLVGIIMYICLCTNSFIASRFAIMFKIVEIVLIPILLEGVQGNLKKICFTAFLSISAVMVYKNLNTYAQQGNYNDEIKGWNYPYVTIFNQEDILLYREEDIRKYPNSDYNFYEHEYFW